MTKGGMFFMCVTSALLASLATALFLRAIPEAHADAPLVQDKTVKAEKFVLVDAKGVQRGLWEATNDGVVQLRLCNKDSKSRVDLVLYRDESSSLNLFDRDGKFRTSLGLNAEGSPGLNLMNKDQKECVSLRVDAGGKASGVLNGEALK